jgi:hypothetical protein
MTQQLALPTPYAADDEPWRAAEWQRLWVATQARPWRSLAVVPGGADVPLEMTLEVAMALARTGMRHVGSQIHVADATRLELENATEFVAQVRLSASTGPVILALSAVLANPVMVPLAQAADCALLCVMLGQNKSQELQRTVEEIGKAHFIGAFTVKPPARARR